jgi:hypothetical protein
MRLTEYGRNPNKRKEYVHQPDLVVLKISAVST